MNEDDITNLWHKGHSVKFIMKKVIEHAKKKGNKIDKLQAQKYVEQSIFNYQIKREMVRID